MRTLIEAVVDACLGGQATGEFGLVPIDAAVLGAVGTARYAQEEVRAGQVHRTALGLAEAGASLNTLVLVQFGEEGTPAGLWTVDGWKFLRSHGADVDLRGASLRGARLLGSRLRGADLSEADLTGADLEKADLSKTDLTGANLSGSTLYRASLRGADLTEAELCRANLQHADLQETVCVRTAMRGADLWEAYMWNVDVSQAFVEGADLGRASHFGSRNGMSTAHSREKPDV